MKNSILIKLFLTNNGNAIGIRTYERKTGCLGNCLISGDKLYDLFGSAPGTIRKDTDGGGKVVARHLPQNKMQFLVMQGKSEKWLQHSFVVSDNVIAKLLEQGRTAVLLYTPSLAMQPAKRMRLVPV